MVKALTQFRNRIDSLDSEIIRLLAERFTVVRQVAHVKKSDNIPAVLPDRIEHVLMRAEQQADSLDLDPEFARKLYEFIVEEACRVEDKIITSS